MYSAHHFHEWLKKNGYIILHGLMTRCLACGWQSDMIEIRCKRCNKKPMEIFDPRQDEPELPEL